MQATETRRALSPSGEAAAWASFVAPASQAQLLQGWLAILCAQLPEARAGLLLLAAAGEAHTFTPAAVWPDAAVPLQALGDAAQKALAERRGVVLPAVPWALAAAPVGSSGATAATAAAAAAAVSPATPTTPTTPATASSQKLPGVPAEPQGLAAIVAYPVEASGVLQGAIVVALRPQAEATLHLALRQLHWASAWLLDQVRQQQLAERDQALARVALANRVAATALQEDGLQPSMLALANELAMHFACDRVSIGFDTQGKSVVQALSNSASFDARTTPLRLLAEAMDETLDLARPLLHPAVGDAQLWVAAHGALARETGALAVWSVPLMDQGLPMGVLCFERHRGLPPDADTQATCQVLGEWLGPILSLKRSDARSPWARARDATRQGLQQLFGPGHGGVKLVSGTLALLLLVLAFAQGEHRVSAKTVVEGAVLRAAVVPFDGFVAEGQVRAGDRVKQGDLLARLDDRDLRTDRARWAAEAEQVQQKLRQAQAQGERAAVNVLKAQLDQAQAQLGLADEKLLRARLLAPFDGVVVSGDLRQLIGTPVQQGKVLFEVAPLDAYRVTLQVDERDIARLASGQRGELRLSGRPGEALPFTVAQITPVAVAEDGRNFFRVEARLVDAAAVGTTGKPALPAATPVAADEKTRQAQQAQLLSLRPGMEGVGKVEVGQRSLLWIWFHPLTDWLRMSLWSWLP